MATLYLIRNKVDPFDVQFAEGKGPAKKALAAVRESAARPGPGPRLEYELVAASDVLSENELAELEASFDREGVAPADLED